MFSVGRNAEKYGVRRRHQVEGDYAHRVGGIGSAGNDRRGIMAGCLCFRDICGKVVRVL